MLPRPARSAASHRTGRASLPGGTSKAVLAPQRMPGRASASFTNGARMAAASSARPPAGCTFHDIWKATKSGIAREALDRSGKPCDIERELAGQPADLLDRLHGHEIDRPGELLAWNRAPDA